ncbi:MAG: hypothetical protein FWG88_00055 [Oscillospiraceae bacterium]|nr:hypothetical protein [Oscillospiraceae bacterium]
MPSHYSDIGFTINNVEEFTSFIHQLYESGVDVPSINGTYRKVVIDEKIEFWIQIVKSELFERQASIVGVEFHFSSTNINPFRFDYWIEPKENLSGEAYVWSLYDGDDSFPMVINIPNADLYVGLQNDDIINVQLACFAEELNLYDSKEEYEKSQTTELKFSDEYFIPSGTFNLDGSDMTPTSDIMFSGYILSIEKRTNSFTGNEYFYFTVRCQGIVFDVLADPALIKKDPKIEGILSGSFWVSGKII